MSRDQTIDFVVMFLTLGLLALGLLSMFVGWALRVWDRVKTSSPLMSRATPQTATDEQTDRQTDYVSAGDQWLDRLEVDRTKTALIELLVYSGWDVVQIRSVVKGDNGAIGAEVEATKQRLGIVDAPRQLRVKDEQGERMIPMEV